MSLSKNTVWNIAGNALPLAVGAITIPLLIHRLGMERFGILTLLWTIIGYFSLFDFGIGRAITQQVAGCLGENRHSEAPAIMKAGLEFTILTGIGGAVLLFGAAYPLSQHGLGISPYLQQETFISLMIAAAGIPLATFSTGLRGAIEAYEHFHWSNLARMFLGTSLFLFPFFAVLTNGPSLITITMWLVGARLLSCFLLLWLVIKLPCGKFWTSKILPGMRKGLFAFGAWMAITNLVSPLLVNADRFIISYLLGASMVAFYTVPFEFLVRLLIIPGALGTTLLPNLAKDFVINPLKAQATMWRSTKITAGVMFVLCISVCLLCYPLMKMFISESFATKSWPLVVILSVGVFINGIAYIPYTALHAQGRAKPTGLLHLCELFLYIPVLLGLVHLMGLKGAAIAWTIRTLFDAAAMFFLYAKQREKYV
ncbi:flippase [Glaciimonas immobilis]|uniref:O-antigen/teichoic acid export membrane protein n=1 Tax=Glaciimonas immobilis TaxID=728004 RepID=A0A840RW34_9BURK|nr:flippase [Glaciimonas immobilis]KAF3997445.1 flippase [Glaciimonas immobilis]MBB5200884.1 O-antigen/teichoic acid export membrane protein [Glaciimonas immobilis]